MKMKEIVHPLLILSASFCAESNAFSNEKNLNHKYECQIEFGLGKSDINKTDIDHCLNKIPKDESIYFVQILSSANEIGNYSFNKKLTDKRLNKVQSYLLKNIKNLETNLISVGKNDQLGKKAHILIFANKQQNINIVTTEASLTNTNKISNKNNQTVNKEINPKNHVSLNASFTYDKKRE